MDKQPTWPSALVAVFLIASVTTIFVVVYLKEGADGAIKVWGAIGTLVGVVVGAIPSYFFHQAKQQTDANIAKLLEVADEPTIKKARAAGFTG